MSINTNTKQCVDRAKAKVLGAPMGNQNAAKDYAGGSGGGKAGDPDFDRKVIGAMGMYPSEVSYIRDDGDDFTAFDEADNEVGRISKEEMGGSRFMKSKPKNRAG